MHTFKAFIGFSVYGLTAFFVLFGGFCLWGVDQFQKPGPLLIPYEFVVERGMSMRSIAYELERQGGISNRYVFMVGARALGEQNDLKAGEYALTPGMSMRDILHVMAHGKVIQRQVTIPEGLTSFEIVQLLKTVDALKGEIIQIPPEGSLLPNTYSYHKGEQRARVLARMQESMIDVINRLWDDRANDLPFETKAQALILASIVEKETGHPEERARVAGVFINRLRKNMLLQTDPTVIYALTKGKHKNDGRGPLGRRLLRKDLAYDSPYNTYLYPGLPPGPIANPGEESIAATLNPEEHDFLYFVADGSGGHVFSKTLAEHNQNARRWREIRRQKK